MVNSEDIVRKVLGTKNAPRGVPRAPRGERGERVSHKNGHGVILRGKVNPLLFNR